MKISIKDFPDNIYLRLNKKFQNRLFQILRTKTTQRSLANKIGVTENTVSEWKINNNRFIPIKAIKKIKIICNIKWNEIEKSIIEYKSYKDTKQIKNPMLPIKDSQELREIVTHIMADGCAEGYGAYYNKEEETKYEFIDKLNKVFGNVGVKFHIDHVNFPMAIPYILSNYFKISFLSKRCRVPKIFFDRNKNYLIGVLKAMVIDEGTIDGSNIRLDSCNKKFLIDIQRICRILNINYGKIWKSIGPIYRFNILAESIKYVYDKIKPLPIKNKEYLLNFACKNQLRNWKYELPGETKKKIIIELLNNKTLTSLDLSFKLKMPRKIINKNTKKLENLGIIEKVGKKVYTNIYVIKNEELAQGFVKDPKKFLGGDKLEKYGITQLKILKILKKNKNTYSGLLNLIKISKGALHKCIKGMLKKEIIKKQNKLYYITRIGDKILELPEDTARYILYANVKDLSKIDLNGFGK